MTTTTNSGSCTDLILADVDDDDHYDRSCNHDTNDDDDDENNKNKNENDIQHLMNDDDGSSGENGCCCIDKATTTTTTTNVDNHLPMIMSVVPPKQQQQQNPLSIVSRKRKLLVSSSTTIEQQQQQQVQEHIYDGQQPTDHDDGKMVVLQQQQQTTNSTTTDSNSNRAVSSSRSNSSSINGKDGSTTTTTIITKERKEFCSSSSSSQNMNINDIDTGHENSNEGSTIQIEWNHIPPPNPLLLQQESILCSSSCCCCCTVSEEAIVTCYHPRTSSHNNSNNTTNHKKNHHHKNDNNCMYSNKHNHHQESKTFLVLQGRGYIQQINKKKINKKDQEQRQEDDGDDDINNIIKAPTCDINGFILPIVVVDHLMMEDEDEDDKNDNDNENNDNYHTNIKINNNNNSKDDDSYHSSSFYYFESFEYGSWITVTMTPGCILRIRSCYCSCCTNNEFVDRTTTITNPINNNNNNTSKNGGNHHDFDYYKNNDRSFQIHYNQNPITNTSAPFFDPLLSSSLDTSHHSVFIRPTLYPLSWQQSCTNILVHDYKDRHQHIILQNYLKQQQQRIEELKPHHCSTRPFQWDDSDHDNDSYSDNDNDDDHTKNVTRGKSTTNSNSSNTDLLLPPPPPPPSHHSSIIIPASSFQVVFCGGKSVGKSSCLRYYINQFLSMIPTTTLLPSSSSLSLPQPLPLQTIPVVGGSSSTKNEMGGTNYRYLLVLDADPGQPEFVLPGVLALTLVSQPILYPPHRSIILLQQQQQQQQQQARPQRNVVLKSFYYGSVTPATNPELYLQCLEELIRTYYELLSSFDSTNINWKPKINGNQEQSLFGLSFEEYQQVQYSVPPLFINMYGWVKGFGYEMLGTVLQTLLQPNHIVQIVSNKSASLVFDVSNFITQQQQQQHEEDEEELESSSTIKNQNVVPKLQTQIHCCHSFRNIPGENGEGHYHPTAPTNMNDTQQYDDDNNNNNEVDYDNTDNEGNNIQFMDHTLNSERVSSYPINEHQEYPMSSRKSNMEYNLPMDSNSTLSSPTLKNSSWLQPAQPASIPALTFRTIRLVTYFSLIVLEDMISTTNDPNEQRLLRNRNVYHEWNPLVGTNSNMDLANRLTKIRPYAISIDSISIQFTCHDDTIRDIRNDSTLFAVLNGSLVGLCCCCSAMGSDHSTTTTTTTVPHSSSTLPTCSGFGIIRSIDPIKRILYILTPCCIEILKLVNVLMISSSGDVTVPFMDCMYQGLDAADGNFPYQSFVDQQQQQQQQNENYYRPTTPIQQQQQNGVLAPLSTKTYHHYPNVLGIQPMSSRNSIGRKKMFNNK